MEKLTETACKGYVLAAADAAGQNSPGCRWEA